MLGNNAIARKYKIFIQFVQIVFKSKSGERLERLKKNNINVKTVQRKKYVVQIFNYHHITLYI